VTAKEVVASVSSVVAGIATFFAKNPLLAK